MYTRNGDSHFGSVSNPNFESTFQNLKISKTKSPNSFTSSVLFSNLARGPEISNSKPQTSEIAKENEKKESSSSFANSSNLSNNPLITANKSSIMKKNLNLDMNSQSTFNYFSKNVSFTHPQTTISSTSLNKIANSRTNPLNNHIQNAEKKDSFIETKPIIKNIPNNISLEPRKESFSGLSFNNSDSATNFKSNSFVNPANSRISPSNRNIYNNSFATSFEKKRESPNSHIIIPNQEPTKFSVKKNGMVKAYAANTNQGIVRNYNEDRVSIILNIMKPNNRGEENWPKCSFFGVYDGHGGTLCADYLRDLLHQYVIKDPNFPWNPKEALKKGFELAEKNFFSFYCENTGAHEKSGSCAIVVLIVGDMCYVANVGDSRAVMSGDGGTKVYPLSRDHKPLDELENKRILEAGGKIYQTKASQPAQNINPNNTGEPVRRDSDVIIGPYRVYPGRLSVTRTFGDVEAKDPRFGGNPNVVIAVPDIKSFKISKEHDFIVLGSDGIFDKLSSKEVIQSVWESTAVKGKNIHEQCAKGVENILRDAIFKKTIDNITVVLISFSNFKKKLFPRFSKEKTNPVDSLHQKTTSEDNNNTMNFATMHSHSNDSTTIFPNNQNDTNNKKSSIITNTRNADGNNEKTSSNLYNDTINKNKFNPFLSPALYKGKTENFGSFKMNNNNITTNNPLLSFKSTKIETIPRKNDNEKTYEKFEIKRDILNGKITMKD